MECTVLYFAHGVKDGHHVTISGIVTCEKTEEKKAVAEDRKRMIPDCDWDFTAFKICKPNYNTEEVQQFLIEGYNQKDFFTALRHDQMQVMFDFFC